LTTPVQQHSKVSVQALVTANELVAKGEARHQAALLEPEDCGKGAAEVDALYARKRQQSLRKAG
jgi:hypothetical protein